VSQIAGSIADNKIAENAGWNEELLQLELAELQALDFDLIGFSDEELDALLESEPEPGLTEDEAVPEVEAQAVSRPGDLWILGGHRLLCGDATNADDMTRLMDGQLADMVFTDPPYNVDYGNSAKDRMRGNDRRILNDNLGESFFGFLRAALANLLEVIKGACYIAMSSSELDTLQQAFRDAGGKWSTFIIWAKNDLHPTMKLVELVEQAVRNSSKGRDIVLDPFGGSGSTLIACEKSGCQARLIELDPKYVDVIIRRWQEYTGAEAELAESGEYFVTVTAERLEVADEDDALVSDGGLKSDLAEV
jgi:DNA modification methylase